MESDHQKFTFAETICISNIIELDNAWIRCERGCLSAA